MKKYYLGLVVIGLVVLGLTGLTLVKGLGGRQDRVTETKANEIATKLNDYVNKQHKVPDSLSQAGVKDTPSTISYRKTGGSSYEFCVTYKEAKTYSSVDAFSLLSGSALGQLSSQAYDSYNYTPSSLFLDYTHKAGKNCKTVQPYFYDNYDSTYLNTSPSSSSSSSSSSSFDYSYTNQDTQSYLSTSANDTERTTDIKALHGQVEAYYAQNGRYPTLANMNDSTWRASNMKGLDNEALRDPDSTSYTLLAAPGAKAYAYAVTSSTGTACNNTTVDCAQYTLTATLAAGGTFTKSNLN